MIDGLTVLRNSQGQLSLVCPDHREDALLSGFVYPVGQPPMLTVFCERCFPDRIGEWATCAEKVKEIEDIAQKHEI